ncbi:MAG: MATE family efflux transporter [Ignavibacteria bacterium]|nr:MATE family efflux transporter [Ignavibacteria bacterium]
MVLIIGLTQININNSSTQFYNVNKIIKFQTMKIFPHNNFYKTILKMALPAIAGLSSQMIVSLVDAAMVGRLDNAEYALAAMGLGVLATWALISFFSSLATGTHILVARRFGKNEYNEISDVFYNSILISIFVGIVIAFFGVTGSASIAQLFAKDYTVGSLTGDYMYFRFLGIPFFLITVSFRGFYFGIGNTKIFMMSAILVNFLNIFFNYIFIYGEFGFKPMGLAGAGLGSSLATVCDVIFYLLITSRKEFKHKFNLLRFKFSPEIIKSIIQLSLPVSFQNIFILVGFLSFVAITGLIGITEQAATQAIISTLFLSFMPTFGFGVAVQTLVSSNIGKGKKKLAKIYGYETAKIATYYTLFLAIFYIFFPRLLLLLITTDESIIQTAKPAMQIAGFSQIIYASGIIFANGLQAVGKTAFVMAAEVITNILIFVPLAYFLGIYLELGFIAAWFALPIYIILYSTLLWGKFRFGRWKTLKDI